MIAFTIQNMKNHMDKISLSSEFLILSYSTGTVEKVIIKFNGQIRKCPDHHLLSTNQRQECKKYINKYSHTRTHIHTHKTNPTAARTVEHLNLPLIEHLNLPLMMMIELIDTIISTVVHKQVVGKRWRRGTQPFWFENIQRDPSFPLRECATARAPNGRFMDLFLSYLAIVSQKSAKIPCD